MKNHTEDELRRVSVGAWSVSEVMRRLGFKGYTGQSAVYIKSLLDKYGITLDRTLLPRAGRSVPLSPAKVLVKDRRNFGRREPAHVLRRALLEVGVLEECAVCHCPPIWQSQRLTLQIDHIDGNCTNNERTNIRFICPNCHSQTLTFSRNRTRKSMPKTLKGRNGPRIGARKVIRPEKSVLEKMVWEMTVANVAARYGVSCTAIAKWCKSVGIVKPPRGYWQKLKAKSNGA